MQTNRRRMMAAALGATVLPAAGWALRGGEAVAQPVMQSSGQPLRSIVLTPRGPDITAELASALTMQPQEIVIPPGDWTVSRTITLNHRQHRLTIRGPERGATITWAGERGGTLFLLQGVLGARFARLTLRGHGMRSGDTLIQLGMRRGFPTAYMRLSEMALEDAGVGVAFASDREELMCSDCFFDFVWVRKCAKGFWVRNTQGLNYSCTALYVSTVDICWHLEQGGVLLVNGGHLGWCKTFLRVDGGGINIGVGATLNNIRSETRVKDGKPSARWRLVEAVARAGCVVNVTGYAATHSWLREGQTDFLVGPGNHVNVTGSTFHRPPRIATLRGSAAQPASISMNGCLFFNGLDDKSFEVRGPRDSAVLRDCRSMTGYFNRTISRDGVKEINA